MSTSAGLYQGPFGFPRGFSNLCGAVQSQRAEPEGLWSNSMDPCTWALCLTALLPVCPSQCHIPDARLLVQCRQGRGLSRVGTYQARCFAADLQSGALFQPSPSSAPRAHSTPRVSSSVLRGSSCPSICFMF